MGQIDYINVALETFGGILSLLFIVCLCIVQPKRDQFEQSYLWMLICNTALLFCDALARVFKGGDGLFNYFAVRITNLLVFILGYVILLLFTYYIVGFLRKKGAKVARTPIYIMLGTMLFAIVLVVVSQYSGMYYTFEERNMYRRGDWFLLSQVFGLVGLLINAGIVVFYRKQMQRREMVTLCAYILLPIFALLFQSFVYSVATLYLSTTICLMCIYINIQMELSRQAAQKEIELEKSRNALLLSQIQPHFLFNTLVGIKQLCDTEPRMASDALDYFSYYLRGNLYALSGPKLISFETELEHVRNYLYLEKMRMNERIEIRWALHEKDFLVPPLTLQPIVENAVRHGLAKKTGGGTLTIKSEGDQETVRIVVTDDGAGFDVRAPLDESRPHIGISNVKNRFESLCGGQMVIHSRPGAGTEVSITLPRAQD